MNPTSTYFFGFAMGVLTGWLLGAVKRFMVKNEGRKS